MSRTRLLTGRQRKINFHGTYSYDVMVRVFPAPGGTISVASQNTVGGVTTYYPEVQGGFVKNGGGRCGLDRPYSEGLTPFLNGLWVAFGASARFENTVYTPFVGGSTELVVIDSTGAELGRFGYNLGAGGIPPNGIANPFFGALDSATHTTIVDTVDSGTWETSLDVAEAIDHLDMPGESSLGGGGSWSISSYLYRRYFEAYRVGGQQKVIKTNAGGNQSGAISPLLTYGEPDHIYHPFAEFTINAVTYSGGPARTGTFALTQIYDGDGFTHGPKAQSFASGAGSGNESSVTMTNGSGSVQNKFPVWRLYTHKIRGYTLGGTDGDNQTAYATINMQNSAFTSRAGAGELTFAWLWKNDSGSISFAPSAGGPTSQTHFDTPTIEEITGTTSPIGFRQYNWIGGPGSMPAGANTSADGYIWYEGFSAPYADIYHTGTRWITRDPFQPIIAPSDPGRGWLSKVEASLNTTVSQPVGPPPVVRIAVGAAQLNPLTLNLRRQRAFLRENFNLDGRYITIRFKTLNNPNQPIRLLFVPPGGGTERWVFETTSGAAGTFVERRFDLLNAGDVGTFEPGTEIPATVARPKLEFTLTIPRQFFVGVEFDKLAPNEDYEIENIRVEREDFGLLHAYGNVHPLNAMAAGGIVDGLPTGIPSLPLPALGTGENPSAWSVVATTPPTPGKPLLFDESLPSDVYYPISYLLESDYAGGPGSRLEGAGYTRDGAIIDADATDSGAPVRVDYYMGGPFLSFYPGAGDFANASGGAYSMTVEPIWTYPTRNALHGLVLGSSEPEVVLQQRNDANTADDNGEGGRGTPGASTRYFATGGPYMRPRKNHRVWLDPTKPNPAWYVGMISNLSAISHARRWALIRLKEGRGLAYDISRYGRHARMTVDGDSLTLSIAAGFATDWSDPDAVGVDGRRPALAYDRAGLANRLWFTYEDSDGKIQRRYTEDEGGNVSMPTEVNSSGTFPDFVVTPWGEQFHIWRTDDAEIEGKAMDAQGNVTVPTGVIVSSDVAEDEIRIAYSPETQGLVIQYRRTSDDSIQVIKSFNRGQSWS